MEVTRKADEERAAWKEEKEKAEDILRLEVQEWKRKEMEENAEGAPRSGKEDEGRSYGQSSR